MRLLVTMARSSIFIQQQSLALLLEYAVVFQFKLLPISLLDVHAVHLSQSRKHACERSSSLEKNSRHGILEAAEIYSTVLPFVRVPLSIPHCFDSQKPIALCKKASLLKSVSPSHKDTAPERNLRDFYNFSPKSKA